MAATDLVTLARAKDALRIRESDISRDPLLQATISAVSERIDEACGPVVARSVTQVFDPWPYDRWMEGYVRTDLEPVLSFTTVNDDGVDLAPEVWSAERWISDSSLYSGRLRLRSGSWWQGEVTVTFMAGRFADETTVNDDDEVVVVRTATERLQGTKWETAALIMLTNWWSTYEFSVGQVGEFDTPQSRFPRFAIPNATKQLLAHDWYESAVIL